MAGVKRGRGDPDYIGKHSAPVTAVQYAELLHGLAVAPSRRPSSLALARVLGANDLLLFLRDPEIGVLLPAPGFPQTLPNGRAWQTFLERCVEESASLREEKVEQRSAPFRMDGLHLCAPDTGEPTEVAGISSGCDTVLVLLGGSPDPVAVSIVSRFLPLVVRAVEAERASGVAEAQARIARGEAGRAEALARSLETARTALQRVLAELRESRARLQQQADELQAANEELEAQAEELQATNEELALQAEELQSTTDELTLQVSAASVLAKALEEARAEAEVAQREAEDANRLKSEFLAAMSHELRTPLNAIAGHVQLIEMRVHGPVTEAQRAALDRVRRNQQHLLSLINDVLNFAKLEAGRIEYTTENLRLADAVADLAPMIESQLADKGLIYEARVPPDVVVRADPDKLRQVLLNLVSNSVKFTERGGLVTIDTAVREEAHPTVAFLRVSDTGCGIPQDKQEAIFDPFVQAHWDLTRTTEGTGLGLAISRDLARGMGGDLRVRSVEGEGSTFTITLPRVE